MYILLALIGAVALGLGMHYALPHRATRGVLLAPAVAAATAAAAYALLTWIGWGEDNVWQWVVTLLASVVVSAAVTLALGIARSRHDAEEARRLKLA